MSYNGSGTFNINSTGQPVVAGTVITASAFNALTTDLATGLTTAITKDGQTTTTARITFAQGITSSLTTDSSSTSTGSIITAGGAGIAKNLYVGSAVKFVGATSGSVGLQAKAVAGSTTFNLPSADGTSNQAMVTDGSGNLSFATLSTTPGGSTTQVQYNSSGAFAGSANMTFSGTALTLANDATISGLTVGKGGGAVSTNTAVGASALASNTVGADSTAIGYQALYSSVRADIYARNTAVGSQSAYSLTTGNENTAVGRASLRSATTGGQNVAIGEETLYSNTTASNNTAVGYQALYSKTGGSTDGNVSVGYQAGYSSTTSTTNTFLGVQAGYYNTTGNSNVMIGSNAGALSVNATTGDGNIYIGGGVRGSAAGNATEIVIGYVTTGKGSSTGFINPNSGGVFQGNNGATWSVTSDKRLKKNIADNNIGLDVINQIQVRNFEYRLPEEITEVPQDQAIKKQGIQLGVIAQELKEILPECVKTESTGVMTVDADNLTWYLINAVKELTARIKQLEGN